MPVKKIIYLKKINKIGMLRIARGGGLCTHHLNMNLCAII